MHCFACVLQPHHRLTACSPAPPCVLQTPEWLWCVGQQLGLPAGF